MLWVGLALLGSFGVQAPGPLAAQPRGAVPLTPGHSILEADAVLLSSGWRPSPGQKPLALDQQRAGVPLSSLTACSGTGAGFCRFDYRRNGRQLSVVTIPLRPSKPPSSTLGGVVEHWWVETVGLP